MIGTARKPMEEILQALDGYEKIAVMGVMDALRPAKPVARPKSTTW